MHAVPFPKQVRIENTNLCNARCTICPREKLTRRKGVMGLDLFRKIIAECAAGGVEEVHLEGFGEPFLDKEIFEKIRCAKERGIPRTFLVTNASLLTEERAKALIASGLDRMKVSFYGVNKQEYERIHRNLKYEEVRDNVRRLARLRKESGSRTPRIETKYIGVWTRYPKFFLQWVGHTGVVFHRLHNYGTGRQFVRVKARSRARKCPMVAHPIMQILWTGEVVPCCYDFNGEMILGHAAENSLKEIWLGDAYLRFRETHKLQEFAKLPYCLRCDKLK